MFNCDLIAFAASHFRPIYMCISLFTDLYLWYDCQLPEYHCANTKGHEQNANKPDSEMAGRG